MRAGIESTHSRGEIGMKHVVPLENRDGSIFLNTAGRDQRESFRPIHDDADDAHDALMTLPPYPRTNEGSGPKVFRLGL
jgi:hypothetical protein